MGTANEEVGEDNQTLIPGDRVKTKPGPNRAESICVVKHVREGHKRSSGPTIEVEVEFNGSEWFYPYWATFKRDELVFVGHGAAT